MNLRNWLNEKLIIFVFFFSYISIVIINYLPVPIPGYSLFFPNISLIVIYYWTLYYPNMLPRLAVFSLGFFIDLLKGSPLGSSAIILMIFQVLIFSQRRFFIKKPFYVAWIGFSAFSFIINLIEMIFFIVVFSNDYKADSLLFKWLATTTFYPLLHALLTKYFKLLTKKLYWLVDN